MSKNTYGPGLGDRFALHAAPEAIAAHLNRMRTDRDRYTRWVKRLEQLHTQRVAERTDGVWPYGDCCNDHADTAASVQGAADGEAQELPGMWENADLAGGQTDAVPALADGGDVTRLCSDKAGIHYAHLWRPDPSGGLVDCPGFPVPTVRHG